MADNLHEVFDVSLLLPPMHPQVHSIHVARQGEVARVNQRRFVAGCGEEVVEIVADGRAIARRLEHCFVLGLLRALPLAAKERKMYARRQRILEEDPFLLGRYWSFRTACLRLGRCDVANERIRPGLREKTQLFRDQFGGRCGEIGSA